MSATKKIAKVNNVSIELIENGDKLIPVKPICEALGVSHQKQFTKLKEDEILSSVVTLRVTTGGDGKQYEMLCIPLKYTFGWLFSINPKNVKDEAREHLIKYKLECYDALYNHFTLHTRFVEERQKLTEDQLEYMDQVRDEFKTAKDKLETAKKTLQAIRQFSYEEWKANGKQVTLFDVIEEESHE